MIYDSTNGIVYTTTARSLLITNSDLLDLKKYLFCVKYYKLLHGSCRFAAVFPLILVTVDMLENEAPLHPQE